MSENRRYDTFENDNEINSMISSLQKKGIQHLKDHDVFLDPKFHSKAMKSTHKMGKKVLATL